MMRIHDEEDSALMLFQDSEHWSGSTVDKIPALNDVSILTYYQESLAN